MYEVTFVCVFAGFKVNSEVIQEIVSRFSDTSYAIDFDSFHVGFPVWVRGQSSWSDSQYFSVILRLVIDHGNMQLFTCNYVDDHMYIKRRKHWTMWYKLTTQTSMRLNLFSDCICRPSRWTVKWSRSSISRLSLTPVTPSTSTLSLVVWSDLWAVSTVESHDLHTTTTTITNPV